MDVWGPVIVGVVITVLGNYATMAYFYGRHSQVLTDIKSWKEDDADPMLSDHEARIAHMEGRLTERHGGRVV